MSQRRMLPVVPLRDTVLFPGVATPITAGRAKTVRAVEAALHDASSSRVAEGSQVFAVAQRDDADDPTAGGLYTVGVLARISKAARFGAGFQLVLGCESRALALRYEEHQGVLRADAAPLPDLASLGDHELAPLADEVRLRALDYGKLKGAAEDSLRRFLSAPFDAAALGSQVAFHLDLPTEEKQALLESRSAEERLRLLVAHLQRHAGIASADALIEDRVREELSSRERELYLREQLRAIQRELGEDDGAGSLGRIEERLERAGLPFEVSLEVRRDLGRMKRMGREGSPEGQMLASWLEWVAELPWSRRTEDRVDLTEARRILDDEHFGLGDVKDRVLELLAVRKLEKQRASRGPILLLLGPPGTGKTSVAESIARALGRRYVRVSLGGARDEADIRGHRRTYVGAMPGRILAGMRRAGSKNPVFVLDEIDKLGASYQGDPAAALLEVLDPAQNAGFVDHYLGLPFDLSEVLFLCTANFREALPAPLLDRMEPIAFSGYTEAEKIQIAERYLVPRQRKECGLEGDQLTLGADALRALIHRYTREAGVRQLERAIGSLGRKAARRLADEGAAKTHVTSSAEVRALLGRAPIQPEGKLDREEPGVATGMYYTAAGGDIMHVEASITAGKGELVLTGQLGEVMRESARAALTWARTRAQHLGIPEGRFEGRDFHLHVPAGAIPKDGPSAGLTMALALVSALLGRPVRSDLAMTGEITLRGRVLAIGGVKEKVLGAHRAGVPEVMLPRDNEGDLDDLGEDVRRSLSFRFVATLDEAIEVALRAEPRRSAA